MTSMTTKMPMRQVAFAGVDTHKATHHAAVIDVNGNVLADRQFRTTDAGSQGMIDWLSQWAVQRIGVEQTGTYGAGLSIALFDAGYEVIDVNQPDVTVRASRGKSDPIDAVMAAEAVRTGRAATVAKDRRGVIESIRFLQIARNSAVKARTAALVQIGDLAIAAPTDLRDRLGSTNRQIVNASQRLRADRARLNDPSQAAKLALRSIAERIRDLDAEIKTLDAGIAGLITQIAPRLLERPQVGIQVAAQLLITAGQNPDRISTDPAFARLTGVAPIPASSGKTNRMRLHRGGDRQANKVIHMVAVGRLKGHQPAIDYLERRTAEGLSKKDAIRAMKRLIARELHGALKADLKALDGL
jgi:transposase